jgi:hypothetical protein
MQWWQTNLSETETTVISKRRTNEVKSRVCNTIAIIGFEQTHFTLNFYI